MRALATVVLVSIAVLLTGCQDPDVGQKCAFNLPGVNVDQAAVSADYFENGNAGCENLVCIKSPVPPTGKAFDLYCQQQSTGIVCRPYCSKPCVSNADCSSGDTALVCRAVVLDPTFMSTLPDDIRKKYLGDIQFANYCALPLP
jgi:hypothetical protein